MDFSLRCRLGALLLLMLSVLLVWWPMVGWADHWPPGSGLVAMVAPWLGGSSTESVSLLTVAFLDVGQGDAIFIETPDGVQMLVDGGPDTSVLRGLGDVLAVGDHTLDVVLATHSDLDHIGGLVDVLVRYEVDAVITTEQRNDTAVSLALDASIADERTLVHMARAGDVITLGASTTFTVLSPTGDPTNWESNNASIVGILRYGDTEFLLTGDAGTGIEEYLVATYGTALASEVLKLGHHGSRTSSVPIFLETVDPDFAVVSAGLDNRYDHPHAEVVAGAEAVGATVVSTAQEGTIVFISDGETVWRK